MSWGSNIYYIYLIKILPRAYIEAVCTLVRRISGSIGSETNHPFTSKYSFTLTTRKTYHQIKFSK